ncbi:hypothetical protein [Micromonospora sp. CPCC 206171]
MSRLQQVSQSLVVIRKGGGDLP